MYGIWLLHAAFSFGGVLKSNSVIMPRVTIHSPEHAVLAPHLLSESHSKIEEAPTYLPCSPTTAVTGKARVNFFAEPVTHCS